MNARTVVVVLSLFPLLAPGSAAAYDPYVGLSVAGAQIFENEDLFFFRPAAYDFFGAKLATGDFNGDGVSDLATGIPWDDGLAGAGVLDCGAVVVRYGVAGVGLETGLADDFLSQQYGGSPDPAEPGDLFGFALAAGDFNGDGIDDLAVGSPREDPETQTSPPTPQRRGAVQIHYGRPGGIQLVGQQVLRPGSNGVPFPMGGNASDSGDGFGWALAAGDFDADGYDDLAIGAPERWEYTIYCSWWSCWVSAKSVGAVLVAGGGFGGFQPFHGFYMMEGDQGLPDTREHGDRFGHSVAAADFNGDGFDDLAIGVPQEDGIGKVLVVMGSYNSLIFANHSFWDQGDPQNGESELGDRFGETLATGDFDGNGYDDLAIGVPDEDLHSEILGTVADAGRVHLLRGAVNGLLRNGLWEMWIDQSFQFHVDYESQPSDHFGWSLAAGDFDRDGRDDLVVGHYGEGGPGGFDVGAVTVMPGSPYGPMPIARRQNFQAGVYGVPGGEPDVQRYFGQSVAAGDFDGDGYSDLAIGAPLQNSGGLTSTGNETVLYGGP